METEHESPHDDVVYPSAIPFVLLHLACFAAIWTGVTWEAVVLCISLYWLRIFAIGAGYHRYFSHRAYSTSRVFQFVLAFLAQSTAQKSVLWWASKHRHHHLHSDTEHDVHSPRHTGFFYSHVGWIFAAKHDEPELELVGDLTRYPELVWLHKLELVPAMVLAALCFAIAGWSGLIVGFVWSTVLVYHATFCINSLAHVSGSTRYVTGDDSRNNWILAIFTMGEGWHNNHHAYQSSARQGFRAWEIDPTYYILKGLERVRLIWDVKTPPAHVLRNEQRLGSKVVRKAAEQLAGQFNAERIALAVASTLRSSEVSLLQAHHRTADILATMHLPHVPTRDELVETARQLFAKTPSLDEIIDKAHELLLAAVHARLTTELRIDGGATAGGSASQS
ncbi:Fatty acid desaturase [Methyloligella halotolerans]|uniref:Fatty acid desaturase n=1 Tax=Methyloligella halotolerans TaxID=1177755 RepID=A0A1E2S2T6_9HYPH|nr:acyl-CoA desaturase [Methyloligella halotolerans]ODA68722.1 Fatty acid desaturase [Methyloligella halotolerans]